MTKAALLSSDDIPYEGGSYALFLFLESSVSLAVGQLGQFYFPAGEYVYFGSALGPGGLKARLSRHLRGKGSVHWHLDYLRSLAIVVGYCYKIISKRLECDWSQMVTSLPGVTVPAPGFGASDCRAGCPAHLFRLPDNGRDEVQARLLTYGETLRCRFPPG